MPNNAAYAAARLSTAPMMDGGDYGVISVAYVVVCAAYVHVAFGLCRTTSGTFRVSAIPFNQKLPRNTLWQIP
ncbi:hypothetical protein MWU52_03920 [Jannaschia sp. S6380]|uniref:hypothetical protein n=1 Tax=Jannaschia sp. S6380 TaxID=2926408 RepID=UPI001FF6B891|nr:hypothetical protein [Jannaschia sp. S6380]MCK0166693.1 hypothetical protein [Jannaschia sp. S6380]